MGALSGTDPDPRIVMDSLGRKQRRSRQRMLTATSGACAAVLAVLGGIYLSGHTTGGATAATPRPSAGPAAAGAPAFYAMTLSSVRPLRGPAIAPGSVAWIPGPAPGTAASPENSMLLAAEGRLFAIVTPQPASRAPAGPTLRLAPVVGGN